MKNKIIKILAFCAVVATMAVVLAGCGNNAQAIKDAYVGDWQITGMVENGQETTSEDLELMRSYGLDVTLNLSEDGKATLNLFGSDMTGTWEASSTTSGKMTLNEEAVDMTLKDGKLTFSQGNADTSLTFEKKASSGSSASK